MSRPVPPRPLGLGHLFNPDCAVCLSRTTSIRFCQVKNALYTILLSHAVRFERAQRRDQDAGSGFRADAAAAPTLLQGPLPQIPLPAEHVPEACPGRGADAADRLDRLPYRRARRLDA